MRRVLTAGSCAALILICASCATTTSQFSPLGKTYPPRPAGFQVEVFERGLPARAFERIARLDVHLEKTTFVGSGLTDALPRLKEQARLAGADAIIEIHERFSTISLETKVYHVTATAIRYSGTP
jgi:hypothetical protein